MQKLSVVIVCKNEADVIASTLESLQGLTDDIVLFDNGSEDDTIKIAERLHAKVHRGTWDGFGKTKQKATWLAKYDWILALDADEAIDAELKQVLLKLPLNDEKIIYSISRKNFLGKKYLRYGEWGSDKQIRLYNRKTTNWDDAVVHEKLVIPAGVAVQKLNGHLLHRTIKDVKEYEQKMEKYARLNAEKYYQQGKKATWLKQKIAPVFAFLKFYILKLGFLDGAEGYTSAKMTAYYTFLKYRTLAEINRQSAAGSSQ